MKSENNFKNIPICEESSSKEDDTFFCKEGVKESKPESFRKAGEKDQLLKKRLQTLIISKGMSESDFYHSLEISKQYWYFISWGIWACPIPLKVRISKKLNTDSSAIWVLKEEKEEW